MNLTLPVSARVPAPAADVTQALRDVEQHGLAILPGVLAGEKLKRVRDALYHAAESDYSRGRAQKLDYIDNPNDTTNRRVANILSRDPLFEDLASHPVAVQVVKELLGWPALLNNMSANILGPGGGESVLHADQMAVPEPWPAQPQGVNIFWCIDDFTDANGGTRVVPGSHKLNRPPRPEEAQAETVAVEAPAGSIIMIESRTWHKTGFNRTASQSRGAIFTWYMRWIYRTQENWFLSLRPEVRQFASEEMLVLLGYKTQGLGLVNGESPA